MSDFLFYALATALAVMSLLVVTLPNLLHSAIALIGSFFATAALYIMLRLEMVALAQIMLYVGGIVIFMLIIILLTTGLGVDNSLNKISAGKWAGGALAAGSLLCGLLCFLARKPSLLLADSAHRAAPVTIDQVGLRLLTTSNGFIVPFEVVSLLLLAALIGAVVLSRRDVKTEDQQ